MLRINSRHAKRIYQRTSLIIVLHLLSNAMLMMYATRISKMVDSIMQSDIRVLVYNLAIFLVCFVLMLITNWANMRVKRWAEYKNTYELRDEFLDHLNSIPMYKLDALGRNNIANRFSSELGEIVTFYVHSLPDIAKYITFFIMVSAYAFQVNIVLFATIICFIPIIYISTARTSKRIGTLSEQCANLDVERNTIEYDTLSSQVELKCYGAFDFISKKVAEGEEAYRVAHYRLTRSNRFIWGMEVFAFISVSTITLAAGALLAVKGKVSFGTVTSFLVILDPIVSSVFALPSILAVLTGIAPIIRRYNEWQAICDEKVVADVKEKAGVEIAYRFSKLFFSYEDDRDGAGALKDVSLDIEEGKKYLIMGKSGTGKSTLLRLMVGYDDRYEGQLFFRGVELSKLGGPYIRERLLFTTDNMFLISGTVADIFETFYPGISSEKIAECLEIVELSFPLKQSIDKGGESISGGERQRLCLALMLAGGRKLMLMDECLSMVSFAQQIRIMKRILADSRVTCVWVDHRTHPALFELFDKIIYLDEDKGIHIGSYAQISRIGSFHALITEGNDIDVQQA